VAADTGLALEEVEAAFLELHKVGLITYDDDYEVVLDRTALRLSPLVNGRDVETGEVKINKAMAGAVRYFDSLCETPLKGEFLRLARSTPPTCITP
jgi:hypothetical protein